MRPIVPIVPNVPPDQVSASGGKDTRPAVPPYLPDDESAGLDPYRDDHGLSELNELFSGRTAIRLKNVELGQVRFGGEQWPLDQ